MIIQSLSSALTPLKPISANVVGCLLGPDALLSLALGGTAGTGGIDAGPVSSAVGFVRGGVHPGPGLGALPAALLLAKLMEEETLCS